MVTFKLPSNSFIKIQKYFNLKGRSPFKEWFLSLDNVAAAKITIALYRLEQGNFSSIRSVGGGVLEYKIDFSSGYRIYFGIGKDRLIILLGGGCKKQQAKDKAWPNNDGKNINLR